MLCNFRIKYLKGSGHSVVPEGQASSIFSTNRNVTTTQPDLGGQEGHSNIWQVEPEQDGYDI